MEAHKNARLEALIIDLQARWGTAAIGRGRTAIPPRYLPTTFPALDTLLGGGLPVGGVSEVMGRPTSGMTTLAYKCISTAQGEDRYAIYIDGEATFDPDYAVRCGVALDRLFVARPDTDQQALSIARDLLESGSAALIALDLGGHPPEGSHLRRLTVALSQSGCVVLLLFNPPESGPLGNPSAAIRLLVERRAWLERHTDIRGYRARVSLLKHPAGSTGHVEISIDFDENIGGEPL